MTATAPATEEPPTLGQNRFAGVEWQVVVDVADPARVEPRHLHAVTSVAIEQVSCDSSGQPPAHRAPDKGYAISPLWMGEDGQTRFSLCTLSAGIQPPVRSQRATLGGQRATLDWSGAVVSRALTMGDLQRLPAVLSVKVRFETPMTRRRGNDYFPSPHETSVLESWERLAGRVGLSDRVGWSKVPARFVHLAGETMQWSPPQRARAKSRRPIGFIGEAELTVPADYGQRLHQLAVLATYGGTGAHTTYGMGFTTLLNVVERGGA